MSARAARVEAFNSRDMDGILRDCDPSVEFHEVLAASVGGGDYGGHDGVRRWHRDLEEVWGDEIRVEVEAFFDLGERTLAFIVVHARGEQSGVEVALPLAHAWTWRDGLIVVGKQYADRDWATSASR